MEKPVSQLASQPPVSSHLRPALLSAALAGLLGTSACQAAPNDPQGQAPNDEPEPQGKILSSVVEPHMTFDTFKSECMQQQGKLEMHSHCGGMNSCNGFSYDTTTQVFTEHTCKALNTCSGYSCVVPEVDAG
jgi:hypothetical protein